MVSVREVLEYKKAPRKAVAVKLTEKERKKARLIGDGNISLGIRLSLEAYPHMVAVLQRLMAKHAESHVEPAEAEKAEQE